MGFSAEKKRELRKKKREAEQAKKNEQGSQMLQLAPPLKLLKAPYKKKDLGKVNVDYGGHQKANLESCCFRQLNNNLME